MIAEAIRQSLVEAKEAEERAGQAESIGHEGGEQEGNGLKDNQLDNSQHDVSQHEQ